MTDKSHNITFPVVLPHRRVSSLSPPTQTSSWSPINTKKLHFYRRWPTSEVRQRYRERTGFDPYHVTRHGCILALEHLDQTVFRFFDLPAELRLQVYDYTLVHDRTHSRVISKSFLLASKQCYEEGQAYLMGESDYLITLKPMTEAHKPTTTHPQHWLECQGDLRLKLMPSSSYAALRDLWLPLRRFRNITIEFDARVVCGLVSYKKTLERLQMFLNLLVEVFSGEYALRRLTVNLQCDGKDAVLSENPRKRVLKVLSALARLPSRTRLELRSFDVVTEADLNTHIACRKLRAFRL